tara:strand:- start:12006 stop:12551 length:546 start_codon:yes stop_codon:yes gene_type:complete
MQVEIEIDLLIQTGMSSDDYLFLYALYRKGFQTLKNLNLSPNLEDLQSAGYVKLGEKLENHVIRQEFIDLFASDFDQMFAELVATYPMKVSDGKGGYRVLHAADPDCRSNEKAKKRYNRIVGNKKFKHDKIMKLLSVQLKAERLKLQYLQMLEVWLNNYTWEKYIGIEDGGKDSTRITRKL